MRRMLVIFASAALLVFAVPDTTTTTSAPPHIILIIADDLGWNDVGFHGSNEIPTPNIDALAYNGIILNRHYVLPVCTPSRASLMTGKYAIRTGLQGDPGIASEPWALPLHETILPQHLKKRGYKTHLVGKWHLGFYKSEFTPTSRGFDSNFGYWNGWRRYNDSVTTSENMIGMDARRNLKQAANEFTAHYATDVFTEEAVNIIQRHNPDTPLYLEVSHLAVHAVRGDILQVPNEMENSKKYSYIPDEHRRLFAGTLEALDYSVGRIVEAMKKRHLLENSVILFISDNGGATEDPNWKFKNSASNWPLRGMKTSLFDGGVRGVAAIWSPIFRKTHFVSNELFHISDWVPTFVAMATSTASNGEITSWADEELDGINQWDYLTGKREDSARKEILVNVNHETSNSAIIRGKWKLVQCNDSYVSTFADKYAGASGRGNRLFYNLDLIVQSKTFEAISKKSPAAAKQIFISMRAEATIDEKCTLRIRSEDGGSRTEMAPCEGSYLYSIFDEPCEYIEVGAQHPDVVAELEERLRYYESLTVPQIRVPADERANPIYWDNYWSPWKDDEYQNSATFLYEAAWLVLFVTAILAKIIRPYST